MLLAKAFTSTQLVSDFRLGFWDSPCCVASSNFSDIHMLMYVNLRHGSTVAVSVVPVVFADLSPADYTCV